MKSEVYFYSGNLQTKVRNEGNAPHQLAESVPALCDNWTLDIMIPASVAGCDELRVYFAWNIDSSGWRVTWRVTVITRDPGPGQLPGAGPHLAHPVQMTIHATCQERGVSCDTQIRIQDASVSPGSKLWHTKLFRKKQTVKSAKTKALQWPRALHNNFMTLKSTIAPLNTLLV